MTLHPGSLAHRLLSVASAEPQPIRVFIGHLERRGHVTNQDETSSRMRRLTSVGYLQRHAVQGSREKYHYALTPAGEQELDRVAGVQ